jgi:hypothetical protein
MTLPRAEALAAALVGSPVRTYLWREARVERVEDGVAAVAGARGEQDARVALADLQAGLDELAAAGEVQVTIAALGPWATYVAAMLVAVEGAAHDDAPARVTLDPAVRDGPGRPSDEGGATHRDA